MSTVRFLSTSAKHTNPQFERFSSSTLVVKSPLEPADMSDFWNLARIRNNLRKVSTPGGDLTSDS